jgi:hypothetical protein
MTEPLAKASDFSLGASGAGLVQPRHMRTSWYDEADGRKKGGAKNRAELCGE